MIPWPVEFANNLKHAIAKKLKVGDVHLVFGRYRTITVLRVSAGSASAT